MKDLESIRNQNIQRNKDLLKKLNIKSISNSITKDSDTLTRSKPSKARKVEKNSSPSIPTRRSRRLANTNEDEDARIKREEEEGKEYQRQQNLKDSRLSKIQGNFRWEDLTADAKTGLLLHEDYVYDTANHQENRSGRKGNWSAFKRSSEHNAKRDHPNGSRELADMRDEFDNKSLFLLNGQENIKMTPNRITSLNFHPDLSNRVIAAGDTSGCLGIWAFDAENEEQSNHALMKPHGRTLSRIVDIPHNPHQFLTASYDGSCRNFDFNKQISTECISIKDSEGYPLGVSDMSMVSENLMYITTLEGHFLLHDIRELASKIEYRDFTRLHDKKIGGFASNPNASHELATASLDRSLKLWDLRTSSKQMISSIDDGLQAPKNTGIYTSRLSVSNVDWNENNSLVCNGYDDTVRVFDLEAQKTFKQSTQKELRSQKEIKHNCQTGRWVSILKSRWQRSPRDGFQKFAIGNMNRSIDIYSENGDKLSSLSAEELTAVPAVLSFHPSMNWIVGGSSSGKVYLFI